ncbi:MAG: hypothetical protein HZB38_15175 [Planctomycetes bacterium]|nr:hypothetical protein [Planctomycetota bacterium]
MIRRAVLLFPLLFPVAVALAQPRVLDACESAAAWKVAPSDGVKAELSVVDGVQGKAVRLTYNFEAGSGFVVIRRELPLDLPPEFRFSFQLRGDSPPNNLEFKLIDPSGDNVWWLNQRAYEFPRDWKKVTIPSRRIQFAWGPAGGKTPLTKISALEFAIAASSGGKGVIDFDQLTFEPIPKRGEPKPICVSFSSAQAGAKEPVELPADWKLSNSIRPPWPATIALDLGGVRQFGGLIIDWDENDYPRDLDVDASLDGATFDTIAQVRGARGGRRYIQIPDGEATHLRIRILAAASEAGVGLTRLELAPPEFGQSANAMWSRIARDAPRGWYPRYFLGEQQPWTVIGVEGDDNEALMDAAGAIELGKGGPRLEPFLYVDGKLITWADVDLQHRVDGPRRIVAWKRADLTMEISAFANGKPSRSSVVVAYEISNGPGTSGRLFLAIRPFQVLPPWHELNLTGGFARLGEISRENQVAVAERFAVIPWTEFTSFGNTWAQQGEIIEFLARDKFPNERDLLPRHDWTASGAFEFLFPEPDGKSKTVVATLPLSDLPDLELGIKSARDAASELEKRVGAACGGDANLTSRVRLKLPESADRIAETFRAMQQYILINADGPRIQPGSRTYERSWIRDGALTGTALLVTGHGDTMRDFLDWYGPYQYPSGKIPCVVDKRGPDPVPENDSHGEYIYAVATYYRFTHDREFFTRHFPRVTKAVEYIESLRAQRMTDEFKSGPPEKRMLYGIVPESISHEGYSAKPMHSYWDGFFTLRGLADAAYLAGEMANVGPASNGGEDGGENVGQASGRSLPQEATSHTRDRPEAGPTSQADPKSSGAPHSNALEQKWRALADDYRKCMYDSMRLTMDLHKIDYVPGCAELGDFDATSTAIGVFPCGERGRAPEPQLSNTFDRYLRFFRDRRDGKIEWREFTPYEVRLVGAFVLMGRPDEAHELLDWFFQYQRPAGWHQWGEVAYRDENYPGFVGDMPHTWVGSDFVNSVRNMFVYERDDALVLAAGVPKRWLEKPDSLAIERFPTPYGLLSYSLAWSVEGMTLTLSDAAELAKRAAQFQAKPLRMEFRIPGDRDIAGVTIDGRPTPTPEDRVLVLDGTVRRVDVRYR